MRILLTGSSGTVGSHTLKYLLARSHDVTAVDIIPPSSTTSITPLSPPPSAGVRKPGKLTSITCDLTDWKAVESLFASSPPFDGVIHFGAIPTALTHDPRETHNTNVTSNYNVLQTAASKGIRRIVQASSVNAIGLSYTPPGHKHFHTIPITEEEPIACEDAYAISKAASELQATALCRFYPGLRIASLRFHMCKPTYEDSIPHSAIHDVYAWTSLSSCASAALLALTSEGWEGHEAFNVAAPEICYQGTPTDKSDGPGTVELLEKHWAGRYKNLRKEWFEGLPRRSVWDSTKAERMLGWDHDQSDDHSWV